MKKIIVCGEENSTPLRLTEIYYCFQEWFRQTKGHSQKPPSRTELKNNLNKKFGDKADEDNKIFGAELHSKKMNYQLD